MNTTAESEYLFSKTVSMPNARSRYVRAALAKPYSIIMFVVSYFILVAATEGDVWYGYLMPAIPLLAGLIMVRQYVKYISFVGLSSDRRYEIRLSNGKQFIGSIESLRTRVLTSATLFDFGSILELRIHGAAIVHHSEFYDWTTEEMVEFDHLVSSLRKRTS